MISTVHFNKPISSNFFRYTSMLTSYRDSSTEMVCSAMCESKSSGTGGQETLTSSCSFSSLLSIMAVLYKTCSDSHACGAGACFFLGVSPTSVVSPLCLSRTRKMAIVLPRQSIQYVPRTPSPNDLGSSPCGNICLRRDSSICPSAALSWEGWYNTITYSIGY